MSSSVAEELTRCAFVVCRLDKGNEPRIVLMKDPRWGDFTMIGGHEEPQDQDDLERTARRETLEELGSFRGHEEFRLLPLTREARLGPVWSKSARREKTYSFKYYGILFSCDPHIEPGYNEAGFLIRFFNREELSAHSGISNVVKTFFNTYQKDLECVPLSWNDNCVSHGKKGGEYQKLEADCYNRTIDSAPRVKGAKI